MIMECLNDKSFEFQSQNGLILTKPKPLAIKIFNEFQSQNGLILTQFHVLPYFFFVIISIPKWSDFNEKALRSAEYVETFQSQNGLILTYAREHGLNDVYAFQSQNGLILTDFLYNVNLEDGKFQSQNGLILTFYPRFS